MSSVCKINAWFILLKSFRTEALCSSKSDKENEKLFFYPSFSLFIEFLVTFKE